MFFWLENGLIIEGDYELKDDCLLYGAKNKKPISKARVKFSGDDIYCLIDVGDLVSFDDCFYEVKDIMVDLETKERTFLLKDYECFFYSQLENLEKIYKPVKNNYILSWRKQ